MRQQVYLEQKWGEPTGTGATLFWLQDPILIPNNDYQISCSVPSVSIPLTHWVITEANCTLQLEYPAAGQSQDILLPLGNFSVDDLVRRINDELLFDYAIEYDEHVNAVRLAGGSSEAAIGPGTTCQELLGMRPGQQSAATPSGHELAAADGVDLSGTSHFYIASNIRTRNRDPVTLGYSQILAKIQITRAHNGLERYSAPAFTFGIWDRHIKHIALDILDDDMKPVVFHGGTWSVTLEFDVVPRQELPGRVDYREFLGLIHNPYGGDGPVGKGEDATADKRPDAADGGQPRGVRGHTEGG